MAIACAFTFAPAEATQTDSDPSPEDCAAGNTILEDDFSDPSSGWNVEQGDGFDWGYQDGEYRVFITATAWNAWAWAPISSSNIPSDFCLELDVKLLVQGSLSEVGDLGVIFAGNPNDRSFIAFSVFPIGDRFYRVRRIDDNFETLVDWTQSDFINPVNSFNTLRVVSKDGEVRLYINDNLVETLNMNVSGSVGVYTHSFDEPNVNGRFDNFKVTGL